MKAARDYFDKWLANELQKKAALEYMMTSEAQTPISYDMERMEFWLKKLQKGVLTAEAHKFIEQEAKNFASSQNLRASDNPEHQTLGNIQLQDTIESLASRRDDFTEEEPFKPPLTAGSIAQAYSTYLEGKLRNWKADVVSFSNGLINILPELQTRVRTATSEAQSRPGGDTTFVEQIAQKLNRFLVDISDEYHLGKSIRRADDAIDTIYSHILRSIHEIY